MTGEQVHCKKCGETKPRDAFYTQSYSSLPRLPCKVCIRSDKRARYVDNDGDRVSHAQVLRERHNLTPAQYETMLAAQDGRCAICGQVETARGSGGNPRRLAVDHDHRTNAVRQLLCRRCNLITGAVEDNPDLIYAVRAYLDRHRTPTRGRTPGTPAPS